MDQEEGIEKELSFDCLRTMVDEAIKTKNICIIDKIEKKNQLRYMQKYAELLVSEKESKISFESYFNGMAGVVLAIVAIGISYFLVGVSKNLMVETTYLFLGIFILIIGSVLWYLIMPRKRKGFEKVETDIKFIHIIILKIEEMLSNRA
jgi:hypothetical protein